MPDPFAATPPPIPTKPAPRPTRAYTTLFWFLVVGQILATFTALMAVATLLATAQPVVRWWVPIAQQQSNSPKDLDMVEIGQLQYSPDAMPVVLFIQQVSSKTTANRGWPTERIFRKVGNGKAELLATVGTVGEFPRNYWLSPDRRSLLINLERKLQIFNLESGELRDLLVAKQEIASASYSPDGTQLFIWDQRYASNDTAYFGHRFSLTTQQDEIVITGEGDSEGTYVGEAWRKDDIIVMRKITGGEVSHYLDLNSGEIQPTPGAYSKMPYEIIENSKSGMIIAVVATTISDLCNDYSGNTPNMYQMVDPVTGKTIGRVGIPNRTAQIYAFSPNDEEVVLASYEVLSEEWGNRPWEEKNAECERHAQTRKATYHRFNIRTGQSEVVEDRQALLREWGIDEIDARAVDNGDSGYTIVVDNQPILRSTKFLKVIMAYTQ